LLLASFPLLSNQKKENIMDICPDEYPIVCSTPFEAVYSYRRHLVGKPINLQGFLVAETRRDMNLTSERTMLLFSSFEHAIICNIRFAIKIIPASDDIAEELEKHYGQFIHIWGWFERNQENHYWGHLKVRRWHSSFFEHEGANSACISTSPPSNNISLNAPQ